ncbi:MAG: DUF4277 domain-containing protein [Thermoplasmata archaeon]|jgi:hypothetical protein|nr:DUF4277 domain-containing protein [Thermoplasmata archaeon]
MALDRSKDAHYEGLNASIALAAAFFEQTGLRELIDSNFDTDVRQKLSPGNAVKALIGDMVGTKGRSAPFNVADRYMSAPVDLMFGPKVDIPALGGRAFSRNLDLLFEIDLPSLTYECYSLLAERYGLSSKVFNVDETNFGITALGKDPDLPDAAVPERCGHAKDGHNERLVYSLLSVTDENGAVCYERPYDGATADSVMDRDAIEFLSAKVDPKESTLIADCKIATGPLVDLMQSKGFGFVAKCPNNFGQKARARIAESVRTGTMDPSVIRKGWEIYDTDAEVDGEMLRFVAFRTTDDIDEGIEYLREHAFRLAKDGMKMSRVYIHRPSRENAMMFVISLGTMVSDVIGHVLKTEGIDTTTDGIAGRWFTLMFKYDRKRDAEYFDGPDVLIDEFLDAVQALGLDPDHLIH